MQYLKSTHHIKWENIHVKNISHNSLLISHIYIYTYTYTCAYIYIHIYVHMYAYIYIHQNVYTHTHVHIHIYAQTELLFTHVMSKHISVQERMVYTFSKPCQYLRICTSHLKKRIFLYLLNWQMIGLFFFRLLVNNARSTSLSLQAVTKCSSFSTILQDRHNRSSTFNLGRT